MKKTLSFMLVISMLAGMSTGAFGYGYTGEIGAEGKNKVDNAIYNYQIPMSLDFAIDPFEKGKSSQVFSGTYPIINMSDVALSVKVKASVEPKTNSNVVLKDSAAEVSQKAGDTQKELYLEAVAAKKVLTEQDVSVTASTPKAYEAPTITAQPTAKEVTFTKGAVGATNAKISFSLAGLNATPGGSQTKGAFTLVVKNKQGGQIFAVDTSDISNISGSNMPITASTTTVVAGLASAKGILNVGTETIELSLDATASGADGTVTFVAGDPNDATKAVDFAKNATTDQTDGWTVEVIPARGKSAAYVLDTANKPEFPLFNEKAADGTLKADGANTRGKIKVRDASESKKDSIWFVLDPAGYIAYFKDGDPTIVNSLDGSKSAAGFRLMGAATPGAAWQNDDIKVKAVFDVAGVTQSSYKKADGTVALKAIDNAQRVYEQPAEVSPVATAVDLKDVYAASSTTNLAIDTYLGTEMKTVSKVEFRAAGSPFPVGSAVETWTPWASPANYTYDKKTGKITLTTAALKLLKDINGTNAAQGGIKNTYKEETMEAKNRLRITFSDGTTGAGATTQTVIIEIPVTNSTPA